MKRRGKECRVALTHICENLGERLDSRRCTAIRKHIEGCEDCGSYLRDLQTVIDLYRRYPIPPRTRTLANLPRKH
jgi:hypothetical protein